MPLRYKFGDRFVADVRHYRLEQVSSMAKRRRHASLTHVGRCHEILEIDRRHLRPDAARRAEIRNAGFGRNARAGEDDSAARRSQSARETRRIAISYFCPPQSADIHLPSKLFELDTACPSADPLIVEVPE